MIRLARCQSGNAVVLAGLRAFSLLLDLTSKDRAAKKESLTKTQRPFCLNIIRLTKSALVAFGRTGPLRGPKRDYVILC